MKRWIVFPLMALALSAADAPPAKKTTPPPAKPSAQAPAIPPGAVEFEPGAYRFTDPTGKTWIYRKTPFGVMKFEDKTTNEPDTKGSLDNVKITEDGDTLWFEKPSPFGAFRWQKKKSELSEAEKAAWQRELAREPAKQE